MKASREQEKRVAASVGGRTQPGSGSGFMHKGDVRSRLHLIECKTTSARSYRLTRDVLDKIEKEALLESREYALAVEIDGKEYAVISWDHFEDLMERVS